MIQKLYKVASAALFLTLMISGSLTLAALHFIYYGEYGYYNNEEIFYSFFTRVAWELCSMALYSQAILLAVFVVFLVLFIVAKVHKRRKGVVEEKEKKNPRKVPLTIHALRPLSVMACVTSFLGVPGLMLVTGLWLYYDIYVETETHTLGMALGLILGCIVIAFLQTVFLIPVAIIVNKRKKMADQIGVLKVVYIIFVLLGTQVFSIFSTYLGTTFNMLIYYGTNETYRLTGTGHMVVYSSIFILLLIWHMATPILTFIAFLLAVHRDSIDFLTYSLKWKSFRSNQSQYQPIPAMDQYD